MMILLSFNKTHLLHKMLSTDIRLFIYKEVASFLQNNAKITFVSLEFAWLGGILLRTDILIVLLQELLL
jgi:hypothetical protein